MGSSDTYACSTVANNTIHIYRLCHCSLDLMARSNNTECLDILCELTACKMTQLHRPPDSDHVFAITRDRRGVDTIRESGCLRYAIQSSAAHPLAPTARPTLTELSTPNKSLALTPPSPFRELWVWKLNLFRPLRAFPTPAVKVECLAVVDTSGKGAGMETVVTGERGWMR